MTLDTLPFGMNLQKGGVWLGGRGMGSLGLSLGLTFPNNSQSSSIYC